MSMRVPLTVRLITARADRHITAGVQSLRFRSVVPGGYAYCRFLLERPLMLSPDEIAYYARCCVYDARNAQVVWEGRLEDPGRGVNSDGQIWELAAVGPSAHAYDRTVPLVYVDRQLAGWVVASDSVAYIDRLDMDFGVIQLGLVRGMVWVTNDQGVLRYDRLAKAGQLLGRVSANWDTGYISSSNELRIGTAVDSGSVTVADSDLANTAGGSMNASRGGSPSVTAGHDTPSLRVIRLTSDLTVPSDAIWHQFKDMTVRALLKDASGADITSGYSADTVLASEVVTDLLGRLLTRYDGAGASVATTSYAIDQLAYPDGVAPGDVLTDLMRFEPGFYWAAWEQNLTGKHRFEWKAWPTAVRYDADVVDGFRAPGSADGLYDAVRVRYIDYNDQPATVRRTQTVDALTAAGFSREYWLDLGAEMGSAANATRAGDQFLAEHRYPPNGGVLTIARPIVDQIGGRMVMPWEILPGQLIRARGVSAHPDALNPGGRDGVTVFRIAAVEYDSDTAAATVELDVAPITVSSTLARAQRARTRR